MIEPKNELGVIFLFGQYVSTRSDCIELVEIQAAFPDATILVNGIRVKAEFEYMASNFIMHGHDVRDCDVVICWENDAPVDFPLPVFTLSPIGFSELDKVNYADKAEKELWYWKNRTIMLERESLQLRREIENLNLIINNP